MCEQIRVVEPAIADPSDRCYNSSFPILRWHIYYSLYINECDMEHFQLQVQLTLNQFLDFKTTSGLDSFSVPEMKDFGIDIKANSCFLCNPYTFDLFVYRIFQPIRTSWTREILAKKYSEALNLPFEYAFLGNGFKS